MLTLSNNNGPGAGVREFSYEKEGGRGFGYVKREHSSQMMERETERETEGRRKRPADRKKEKDRGKEERKAHRETENRVGRGWRECRCRCKKPSIHWTFNDTSEWTGPFFSLYPLGGDLGLSLVPLSRMWTPTCGTLRLNHYICE